MYSRLLLFFSALVIVHFNYGQSASSLSIVTTKEYEDEIKSDSIISFYTSEKGYTGVIRESKKNLVFDIFDQNFDRLNVMAVDRDKKETILGDLFFGNEIKVFTEYAVRKNERLIFCHIFNIQDQSHRKVKLYETITEGRNTLYSELKDHQTLFAISDSGNYLALCTDNIDKDDDSYLVRVFDSKSLEELYTQPFLENNNNHFELIDLTIGEDTIVYSLGKLYEEGRREIKNNDPNYHFILNKLGINEKKRISIELSEEFIHSLVFTLLDEKLQLIGLYSERNTNMIKGGCTFDINLETLSIEDHKKYDLPVEVFEDLYGEKRAERKKGNELSNFNIDYTLRDDGGNTYLLAEEFYTTSNVGVMFGAIGGAIGSTATGGSMPHYDDILVLKFDNSGSLTWGRSVLKKSFEHSYNAFIKGDNLNIVLNSGQDLEKKKDGRVKVSQGIFEGGALYHIIFNKLGETSINKIQNYETGYRYQPQYGTYFKGSFIMTNSGRKQKKFMVLQ